MLTDALEGEFVPENIAVELQRVPVFSYDRRKHLRVFISHNIIQNNFKSLESQSATSSEDTNIEAVGLINESNLFTMTIISFKSNR